MNTMTTISTIEARIKQRIIENKNQEVQNTPRGEENPVATKNIQVKQAPDQKKIDDGSISFTVQRPNPELDMGSQSYENSNKSHNKESKSYFKRKYNPPLNVQEENWQSLMEGAKQMKNKGIYNILKKFDGPMDMDPNLMDELDSEDEAINKEYARTKQEQASKEIKPNLALENNDPDNFGSTIWLGEQGPGIRNKTLSEDPQAMGIIWTLANADHGAIRNRFLRDRKNGINYSVIHAPGSNDFSLVRTWNDVDEKTKQIQKRRAFEFFKIVRDEKPVSAEAPVVLNEKPVKQELSPVVSTVQETVVPQANAPTENKSVTPTSIVNKNPDVVIQKKESAPALVTNKPGSSPSRGNAPRKLEEAVTGGGKNNNDSWATQPTKIGIRVGKLGEPIYESARDKAMAALRRGFTNDNQPQQNIGKQEKTTPQPVVEQKSTPQQQKSVEKSPEMIDEIKNEFLGFAFSKETSVDDLQHAMDNWDKQLKDKELKAFLYPEKVRWIDKKGTPEKVTVDTYPQYAKYIHESLMKLVDTFKDYGIDPDTTTLDEALDILIEAGELETSQ